MSIAQSSGLLGRTVLIIGTCTGVGLATARRAKGEGAQLILTDRRAGPLEDVADDIGVEATAAFDESDVGQLQDFLDRLPAIVDHVLVSEIDLARGPGAPIRIARYARQEMRDGGSLVFIASSPALAALPAVVANLAVEAAPVRINVIARAAVDGSAPAERFGGVAVLLMIDPLATGKIIDLG